MSRSVPKTDPYNSNQSTERLLALLEFLADQAEPTRLVDIAGRCQMNISTVSRFLTALRAKGYVVQDADSGRYSLSFKICRLGSSVKSHADLCGLTRPLLRQLAREFGESVSLMVEHGGSALCLDTVSDSSQLLLSMQRSGSVLPLHCTDAGKLFLCSCSPPELEKFTSEKGLTWYTENTITTLERLRRELVQVRAQGYATDQEEFELGVRGAAAPIKDYTNKTIAAISVSAPTARMTAEHLYDLIPPLVQVAAQASERMGYDPERDSRPAYRR